MDIENPQPGKLLSSRNRTRLAVSLFYFGQGICFASWASRIPDLKHTLNLSDAQLGSVLLALPLGQLFTMPISGKLVTAFGSRTVLIATAPLYGLALTNIGLSTSIWHLAFFLFLFGVAGNMCNISLNTQGVAAEQMYGKPIMTSFHGAWSLGGFSGALFGLLAVNLHQPPYIHFWIITVAVWVHILINYRFLVPGQKPVASPERGKLFRMPEGILIQLGVIGFCSMATEGAMFDWSGVYFKEIVKAPVAYVVLGYASFMIMMATGRFLGDKAIARFGRKRWLQISGVLISGGMFLSVFLPYLVPATIGFMLVGVGVSGIVPMVYTIAGNNKTVAPGMALAMVSGVSYFGFLLGPPLIGYISALASLRYSYAIIGCFGIFITFIVAKISAIR
ncbi:MFS transporter [Pedobacter duraquae]|uniref:Putative MFS family arabinose efflux permease n=1 Tax=Pedobacter duraquae TaxID=425511 RepID=A0A4R6ICG4_9SPHI|nr:MFS transporter [Pedobacter duraquae]TDO19652.1 putative MFS family arabinose efflux permease [Pedobacter duraquae]